MTHRLSVLITKLKKSQYFDWQIKLKFYYLKNIAVTLLKIFIASGTISQQGDYLLIEIYFSIFTAQNRHGSNPSGLKKQK